MSEFEKYARAIQEDLASLKKGLLSVETGLKGGISKQIKDLRDELKADIAVLPTKAEMHSAINLAKKEIFEEMGKYKYAKEIDHLRGRMNIVEDHLGIKREKVAVEE